MDDVVKEPDAGKEPLTNGQRADVAEHKLTHRDTARWRRLATLVVSLLLLSITGIGYTTYVDGKRAEYVDDADRRWCKLLVLLDDQNKVAPPPGEIGRQYAQTIHELRVDLNC